MVFTDIECVRILFHISPHVDDCLHGWAWLSSLEAPIATNDQFAVIEVHCLKSIILLSTAIISPVFKVVTVTISADVYSMHSYPVVTSLRVRIIGSLTTLLSLTGAPWWVTPTSHFAVSGICHLYFCYVFFPSLSESMSCGHCLEKLSVFHLAPSCDV